jgi:glycosyltransferase involved in cell wall biosynthesis
MKGLLITKGLHPPWNMGEAVLARNFIEVLKKLYDDVKVFSTIDSVRGELIDFEIPGFKVNLFRDEKEMKIALVNELRCKPQVDVHLINSSLLDSLGIIRKVGRIFLYQFAYNVLNVPGTILRSLGALPLTYLSKINVITTSLSSYRSLSKLFRKRYHYVPAPIIPLGGYDELPMRKSFRDGLNILYLGHGSYPRFPYDKVLKAIAKLREEGIDVKLKLYISKLRYANYLEFVRGLERVVERLRLRDAVSFYLGNLSEAEKWRVISASDIVLYPALINAAIDPPLVVLEAMFMGRCVVATPVQSIPYLLSEGRGIIVDQKNLDHSIYKAIKMLTDNPAILRLCGENARRWVMENHSIDAVCSRMREILNEQ